MSNIGGAGAPPAPTPLHLDDHMQLYALKPCLHESSNLDLPPV